MTITFTIVKSRQRLEKQWRYLVKKGVNSLYYFRNFFMILIISTGLYFALYFLTPLNTFIELKGVGGFMILAGWLVIPLFAIFIYFRNIRNTWRLKKFLNSIDSDQLNYDVQINDEYVRIISAQNIIELPWSEFSAYGIYDDTIYVYNKVKALNTLYWDRDEMGNNSYTALLDLLKQKSITQIF